MRWWGRGVVKVGVAPCSARDPHIRPLQLGHQDFNELPALGSVPSNATEGPDRPRVRGLCIRLVEGAGAPDRRLQQDGVPPGR